LKDIPSRLVYNFDECGFCPGQGKSRKVIGQKGSQLAEASRGENITMIECIAADGWQMDPFLIFTSSGIFMESWFYGSEDLPPNTTVAVSPTGWINDRLALVWLDLFNKATSGPDRLNSREKRVLIFDGHGTHLTLEFLQFCEEWDIIPFGFLPHTTHLCQPLDGKPFLSFKQHFRLFNNEIAFWAGQPVGKSDFLRIIGPIRKKAFNQRIIRDSFKDRGIWPVDGSKIVDKLGAQLVIPDLIAPDLQSHHSGSRTPSPIPNLLSSSVDSTPPKSIEAIEKAHKKISKRLNDACDPKLVRDLTKVLRYHKAAQESLSMAEDTIQRIRAYQEPLRRNYTKRQVKPLSQTGVLKPRDANRSIVTRRAKEAAAAEKRLRKQWKEVYGEELLPTPTKQSDLSIERERAARERGDLFFYDNEPLR
jgi:hypothetical protein